MTCLVWSTAIGELAVMFPVVNAVWNAAAWDPSSVSELDAWVMEIILVSALVTYLFELLGVPVVPTRASFWSEVAW